MTKSPSEPVPNQRIAQELAALRRARRRAEEIALLTGTALIFSKDGVPVRVEPKSPR